VDGEVIMLLKMVEDVIAVCDILFLINKNNLLNRDELVYTVKPMFQVHFEPIDL
jgi:hypothetical protein